MIKLLFPIILFAAATGLFMAWTSPTYQEIKALASRSESYDQALSRAQELRATRDQLLSKRNTFSTDNVQKLERLLPDNVDNIRLIIDINNIAARHNLALSNVQLGDVANARAERSVLASGASADPVGSVEVGFSLTASYEAFLLFLADLERSLRLVDVESVSFTNDEGGATQYAVTIRTYWLR